MNKIFFPLLAFGLLLSGCSPKQYAYFKRVKSKKDHISRGYTDTIEPIKRREAISLYASQSSPSPMVVKKNYLNDFNIDEKTLDFEAPKQENTTERQKNTSYSRKDMKNMKRMVKQDNKQVSSSQSDLLYIVLIVILLALLFSFLDGLLLWLLSLALFVLLIYLLFALVGFL